MTFSEMNCFEKTFAHRRVCAYPASTSDCYLDADVPVVYSLEFEERGEELLAACDVMGCAPFHLVTVSGLHWDEELSPWQAGLIVSRDDHFTGEAADTVEFLTQEVIPWAEEVLPLQRKEWPEEQGNESKDKRPEDVLPSQGKECPRVGQRRILSGYSMAGLFALYAGFKTDEFSALVSASGSLWFPDIVPFVEKNELSSAIKSAYFSIGDKESRTRNLWMKITEQNTRHISELLHQRGVITTFALNPGNHFTDTVLREAKGICWVLENVF